MQSKCEHCKKLWTDTTTGSKGCWAHNDTRLPIELRRSAVGFWTGKTQPCLAYESDEPLAKPAGTVGAPGKVILVSGRLKKV